jgi:DNA polymerase-4
VADLLSCPESALRSFFGRGWREVRAMALGEDDRPVEVDRDEAKSYSEQETFGRDIADRNIVEGVLKRMIDDLLAAIRFDGKRVRTMTVRVRHPDFSEASAGRTLARGSDLSADFYPLVRPLLAAAWKVRRPLRLVGVQFSGVAGRDPQLELFADSDERRRLLAEAVDRLNAGGATRVMQGHRLLPRPGSRRA